MADNVAFEAVAATAEAAREGHDPVATAEGWVDCSCGWESNRIRLPSDDEIAQRAAAEAFDATIVPPCPYKPELHPSIEPTPQEVDDLRAWNAWQREWANRVRPIEPTQNTGAPDPDRTNDTEWQAHLASVGRDAAIEKHFEDGGTIHDLPVEVAMLGVEQAAT